MTSPRPTRLVRATAAGTLDVTDADERVPVSALVLNALGDSMETQSLAATTGPEDCSAS